MISSLPSVSRDCMIFFSSAKIAPYLYMGLRASVRTSHRALWKLLSCT